MGLPLQSNGSGNAHRSYDEWKFKLTGADMETPKLKQGKPANKKAGISTAWDNERSEAEEQQSIEGVGRAGAPTKSLEVPGLSSGSAEQIRNMGVDRIRVSRPGGLRSLKASGSTRKKTIQKKN
jgi:hypothetical protein